MSFLAPVPARAARVPLAVAVALIVDRRRARYPVAFTNLAVLAEVVPCAAAPGAALVPLALLLLALAFAAGGGRAAAREARRSPTRTPRSCCSSTSPARCARTTSSRPGSTRPSPRCGRSSTGCRDSSRSASSRSAPSRSRSSRRPRTATRSASRSSCSSPRPGPRSATGWRRGARCFNSSLRQAGYVRKPGQDVPGAIVLLSDGAQNRGILQPLEAARSRRRQGSASTRSRSAHQRQGHVRLRRVHELGAGAAGSRHDEPDRRRHRWEGVHGADGLERRPDLQDARLEHRPHPQARPDHLVVRGAAAGLLAAAVGAAALFESRVP